VHYSGGAFRQRERKKIEVWGLWEYGAALPLSKPLPPSGWGGGLPSGVRRALGAIQWRARFWVRIRRPAVGVDETDPGLGAGKDGGWVEGWGSESGRVWPCNPWYLQIPI